MKYGLQVTWPSAPLAHALTITNTNKKVSYGKQMAHRHFPHISFDHRAKFGCCFSYVCVHVGGPKTRGMLGPALWMGHGDPLQTCFSPTRLIMPILVILGQTIQAYLWRSTKDLSPHSHLSVSLQVTGTNTDRSAAMTSC